MFDLIQKSNYSNHDGINQQNDTPKYVKVWYALKMH